MMVLRRPRSAKLDENGRCFQLGVVTTNNLSISLGHRTTPNVRGQQPGRPHATVDTKCPPLSLFYT